MIYEKISKIEFLEETDLMIDLEVEDNNNFILKNNLITHNSLTFNARESMGREARDLGTWLATTRHKGFSVLFVSQHSSLIDVNIMRFSDVLLIKKLSWEEMNAGGRQGVDLLYEYMQFMSPIDKSEILFTDGENWNNCRIGLPSFWSDEVSTSYKKMDIDDGLKLAIELDSQGVSIAQIERQLKNRNILIMRDELKSYIALHGERKWKLD